jgi:triosephosphate isomerase (TIM)
MDKRKSVIAANWKMNGNISLIEEMLSSFENSSELLRGQDVFLHLPYVFLDFALDKKFNHDLEVKVGAQNLSQYEQGAYTGEISSKMLKELGCSSVLVGHSERRNLFNEDNAVVAQKFAMAIESKLTPILCIGENLKQRESGNYLEIILEQLSKVIELNGIHSLINAIIAYEPVWAIGTGKHAKPDEAQEVHLAIRSFLKKKDINLSEQVRIIYGGSVHSNNAETILRQKDIDGVLVGGASLSSKDFINICEISKKVGN